MLYGFFNEGAAIHSPRTACLAAFFSTPALSAAARTILLKLAVAVVHRDSDLQKCQSVCEVTLGTDRLMQYTKSAAATFWEGNAPLLSALATMIGVMVANP